MKPFRARYTQEAAERIRRLHPHIKREIREGIREIVADPLTGHPLQFDLEGLWSYRVRVHRLIYRINDEESSLDIIFVGPRRTVYEELRTLLLNLRSND